MDEGDGKGDGISTVVLVGFPLLDEGVWDDDDIDVEAKGGGGGRGF